VLDILRISLSSSGFVSIWLPTNSKMSFLLKVYCGHVGFTFSFKFVFLNVWKLKFELLYLIFCGISYFWSMIGKIWASSFSWDFSSTIGSMTTFYWLMLLSRRFLFTLSWLNYLTMFVKNSPLFLPYVSIVFLKSY